MSRLADAIARYTRGEIFHRRQIRRGSFVRPYGLRRGLVRLGACGQIVRGDRLSDLEPGASVLVASDGPRTILSAPPTRTGPATAVTRRLSGEPYKGTASLTVSVFVTNDGCGTLTEDGFSLFLDGAPIVRDAVTEIPPGPHVLTTSPDPHPDYTIAWSGDCDASGAFEAVPGGTYFCDVDFDDKPLAITGFFACQASGGSGAPGDDYTRLTKDWTHAVTVHGPCIGFGYTASVVFPASGVTFTPNGNITSSENPSRCTGCDATLGTGWRMGDGLTVDASVPTGTVIRISLSGPEGTVEADAFEVVSATGNPNNTPLGPC